jgi:crotonobetainyl-CoA:carnitine CoA-transferase CaiB-like acyl-CoA transferase
MAKAGADVIKIEPPQGEPLRRRLAFTAAGYPVRANLSTHPLAGAAPILARPFVA